MAFIRRCLAAVQSTGGVLVLKENMSQLLPTAPAKKNSVDKEDSEFTPNDRDYIVDAEDSSVTRSERAWRRLIARAGGRVVAERRQLNFPASLFPVKM